ncbi:spore germination protein [Alkalihalobacillus sp. MEB130]|uniref:spore germination protein n=1 Tax=Alkalihalobacillus sp. MEB130 TaxID=2976704 RepID=UPI0028DE18E8|nr:spore germination protein [Alkalihalobacillus sp. MEB130]MDT8860283.1 spore germination protein [Alkalihalobacillus sp. MEB130]
MPSIIGGPIKILSNSGVVNFGDTLNSSPKSVSKSVTGAGSSHTGDFQITNTGINMNNVLDPDVSDQNQGGNV